MATRPAPTRQPDAPIDVAAEVPVAPPVWLAPFGPVAVLGLVASAWLGPDDHRPKILTAAALLGAGLVARQPGSAPAPTPTAHAARLSDDELRAAIAAW